jgi:linoleoyl-CoA desaturase
MAFGGRILIFASLPLMPAFPVFLGVIGLGTASLGISKILENMEVGHNILHGQWDWMQDPQIHSSTWEWDNVCPADQWKHSHNVVHHTWTNVMGRDRDVGYEILRISEHQPWKPAYLAQPFYNVLLALLFEWGVAMHDIDLGALRRGELTFSDIRDRLGGIGRKATKQIMKDYVLWPLLAGPWFLPVLLANATANVIRNLWTRDHLLRTPGRRGVFTERR